MHDAASLSRNVFFSRVWTGQDLTRQQPCIDLLHVLVTDLSREFFLDQVLRDWVEVADVGTLSFTALLPTLNDLRAVSNQITELVLRFLRENISDHRLSRVTQCKVKEFFDRTLLIPLLALSYSTVINRLRVLLVEVRAAADFGLAGVVKDSGGSRVRVAPCGCINETSPWWVICH